MADEEWSDEPFMDYSLEDESLDREENEEGCCFPESCIMPGFHLRSECCTAEMMDQLREDGQA